MLFLSGQFSWVNWQGKAGGIPLPVCCCLLSAAWTVLCVCILSRRQLLSVALHTAALRSQTWLRLSCLCTAYWRQLQSLPNGKKILEEAASSMFICVQGACVLLWLYLARTLLLRWRFCESETLDRRSDPSFCIVACFWKRALQATRPNKQETFHTQTSCNKLSTRRLFECQIVHFSWL